MTPQNRCHQLQRTPAELHCGCGGRGEVCVIAMKSASECRKHAKECRSLAKAFDDARREQALELARMWELLARDRDGEGADQSSGG
jgi:hypothetical protein